MWDGNLVCFSFIIFFINSTFILSSCVNIYFVVLGSMASRSSEFCFAVGGGGGLFFSVFRVLIRVWESSYNLHYLFVDIFLISHNEKKKSFNILQAWIFNQAESAQIPLSISIPSFCKTALKLTVKYISVVFSRQFLLLIYLTWVVALVVVYEPDIRRVNIRRMPIWSAYFGSQGSICRSRHSDL